MIVNEIELAKATGMLWKSDSTPPAGESATTDHDFYYSAIDAVHGLKFNVVVRTSFWNEDLKETVILCDSAEEEDVLGGLGIPLRKLFAPDVKESLRVVVYSIQEFKKIISKSRSIAAISMTPDNIVKLRKERLNFYNQFKEAREILPIFKFSRIAKSNTRIHGSNMFLQEYYLKSTCQFDVAKLYPGWNGSTDFYFRIRTDRRSVLEGFSNILLSWESEATYLIERSGKSSWRIYFTLPMNHDLSNLVDFADSKLGKLFNQYFFDRIEK